MSLFSLLMLKLNKPYRDDSKVEQKKLLCLEELTASFMRGELTREKYADELEGLNLKIDLRRIASKIHSD